LQYFPNDITPKGLFTRYYKHVGDERVVVVPENQVPAETTLRRQEFPLAERGSTYTSPKDGGWIEPGPKRGSFTAKLADGSLVTFW
jgi:hypothetical protein